MSERRKIRSAGAKPTRAGGGIIPDELVWPNARDRLKGSWSTDELEALKQARREWYADNGFDYQDWQTRHRVERGL